jgi:geranylgeranyl reductase family protein
MSETVASEVVVVGGGIAGSFAAATAAAAGADVVQLERKSRERGGFVACGDAIKSPRDPEKYPGPIDMDAICDDERVLANGNIDQIEYWDRRLDVRKELPYAGNSNVIDRYEFGQHLLQEVAEAGADQHYDTVVRDIVQNGRVSGVEAVRDSDPVTYEAEVVVDAAGAQSLVQDLVEFDELEAVGGASFEQPHYTHFGSAYREIIETEEPVDFANAIVGKPLERMGYVWYFPRTPTTINAGLGFQMSKEPIPLADRLKRDMQSEPALADASVERRFGAPNKLGSSIALRRPLDSMVAPGYLAAGGAAATTHPISGKGIRGAAISGYSAGRQAARAVHAGDASEASLWGHNHYLFAEHGEGAKLATRDAYNVAASAHGISLLRAVAALLPEAELKSIVGTESKIEGLADVASVGLGAVRNAVESYRRGVFEDLGVATGDLLGILRKVRTAKRYSGRYDQQYADYPETRDRFYRWQARRDSIDDSFYDALGLTDSQRKY